MVASLRPTPDNLKLVKATFNKFFRDDIYGRFKADDNVILSRGAWNDCVVEISQIFQRCLKLALKNRWVGYSDSLMHDRVAWVIPKLFGSAYQNAQYDSALTLGNTATFGPMADCLRTCRPKISDLIVGSPYYPPIVCNLARRFGNIGYFNALGSESDILSEISERIGLAEHPLLLISNVIGVEGRTYTVEFWKKLTALCKKRGNLVILIDEELGFTHAAYPSELFSLDVVRLVSLSKRFGCPGIKAGIAIGPRPIMQSYYDFASTSYGGPQSVFFLLTEFLLAFEVIRVEGGRALLHELSGHYGIPYGEILAGLENFLEVDAANFCTLQSRLKVFRSWALRKDEILSRYFDFGGLNVFIEPKRRQKTYDLFLELIQKQKVSIMPGICLGDLDDGIFRISLLESEKDLRVGLNRIGTMLGGGKYAIESGAVSLFEGQREKFLLISKDCRGKEFSFAC